jgi:hypothetical protein
MNHLTKLVIALVLGGIAAATNMAWLQQQKTPPLYVGARADIRPGTVITEDSLAPVPVPGDPDRIGKSFIPYRERSVLFGSRAQRSYRVGDLFIYRDMRLPAQETEWEELGPFRIVGVGGVFKEKSLNEQRVGGGGNNVTIAISNKQNALTKRLWEVLDNRTKILAVQVIPADEVELTREALKQTESESYVYQTIPLAGIESIPTVLYSGDVIRFILPRSTGY